MNLRSFSWKGVMVFIGFAAALTAWTWSGVLFTKMTLSWVDHGLYFLALFQRNLLNYFPAYVLVGLADGLDLRSGQRKTALIAALVTGIAIAVQVRCAVNSDQMFYVYASTKLAYCTTFPTWRTYIDFPASWISPLTIAGMVMVFVFTRRRDKELVESLHRAQSGQLEARRQRIESEIDAMHSRVDPDRLLASLRSIRARYETSLEEGGAMLDSLTDDLRRAARHPSVDAA